MSGDSSGSCGEKRCKGWMKSGRPWEHQDNPLLRRYRNPARQLLFMLGIAAVLALIFVFLFLGFSPSTPQ
jgi:hypothetical protein